MTAHNENIAQRIEYQLNLYDQFEKKLAISMVIKNEHIQNTLLDAMISTLEAMDKLALQFDLNDLLQKELI